jgi:type III restriction enzyme
MYHSSLFNWRGGKPTSGPREVQHMDSFFERPILNSPYAYPGRHWELDEDGQPTNQIIESRRRSELITPVPKPQRRRRAPNNQAGFVFDSGEGLSTEEQEYNPTPIINEIRAT